MGRIEKTAFLSYRRTNAPWALAIFQDLTHHGYDVFFDFNGIPTGDFKEIIVENIRERAHFLLLLTPSALERCGEPGDLFRREIETALGVKRNIVPLMLEGFSFDTKTIASQLTGELSVLRNYNALNVSVEFFPEAMERLRTRYLNVALEAVLHPATSTAVRIAKEEQAAAAAAPAVTKQELTAQKWFERGVNATDPDEKLRCYGEAICLNPNDFAAFNNRGTVRNAIGDQEGAIQDYDAAIGLKPDYSAAFNNRGVARRSQGDLKGAIRDFDDAIRLKPDYAEAYYNRGHARRNQGDLEGARKDFDDAIRLRPDFAFAFNHRGILRYDEGDPEGARKDYNDAIRLKPGYANAYFNRGNLCRDEGDLDGALKDYNETIRLKPDYADAYYNRALVWQEKNNPTAAIADLQKYLDLGGGERDGDTEEVEEMIDDLQKL